MTSPEPLLRRWLVSFVPSCRWDKTAGETKKRFRLSLAMLFMPLLDRAYLAVRYGLCRCKILFKAPLDMV